MTLRDQFGLPIDATFNQNQYPGGRFHAHPDYEIYYFHDGGCTYLIGGRMFELAPGDLVILHGMTLHAPIIDPRRPYVRTIVHFDPAFAARLLRPPFQADALAPFRELGNARVRLSGERRERVETLLGEMCELFRRTDAVSCNRFLIAFLRLLHDVCDCFAGAAPGPETAEPADAKARGAQRIAAYLEERYMDDIHLDALERELHMNRYYMTRLFKAATGFTIFEYLYQRRIAQAKALFLLDPDRPVTEVGYEVGFKHPSHFTRAFKRIAGQTPEAFRRSLRGAPQHPGPRRTPGRPS